MKQVVKLVLLDAIVVIITFLSWSPADEILSFTTGSYLMRAVSMLLFAASIIGGVYWNIKWTKPDKMKLAQITQKAILSKQISYNSFGSLEECYEELKKYKSKLRFIGEMIDTAMSQIELFLEKKETFNKFLESNPQYSNDTYTGTVDLSEKHWLENINKLLVRLQIMDPREASNNKYRDLYAEHYSHINNILEANEGGLATFSQFLTLITTSKDKADALEDEQLNWTVESMRGRKGLKINQQVKEGEKV